MKRFSWAAFGLALLATAAAAETFEVSQKGNAFVPGRLTVKAGDRISFRNDDTAVHNVYSVSSVKKFDTGMLAKGQAKTVVFERPGTVEVGCAVHPEMQMTVEVRP